jgi:hypothetical protein
MSAIDLPFGYIFIVRLRTRLRIASFFLAEWIPIVFALTLAYSSNWVLTVMMLAGNSCIYECGYLVNDLADSAAEPNGDHLEGRRVNYGIFLSSHTALFGSVMALLLWKRGIYFIALYAILSLSVLLLFVWHTTRWPKQIRFLRIFTFTTLYLYKFSPIVVPQVPLPDAAWILTSLFFCWGLWRMVFYVLMKFGSSTSSGKNEFDTNRILHPLSLIACAPMFLVGMSQSPAHKAGGIVWVVYALIAGLRSGFQQTPWHLRRIDEISKENAISCDKCLDKAEMSA